MITYEKLFILLEKKGHNKAWLRKNGLSSNNVDWLVKNKDVKISTIDRLCNLLDCEPCDILTFTKDNISKGELSNERQNTNQDNM